MNVCVNGKQKSSIKTNGRFQNVAKFIPLSTSWILQAQLPQIKQRHKILLCTSIK